MSGQINEGFVASLRERLLNASRIRGEAYDLTLTRFATERFLYRLSCSEVRSRLVLKGATLFQVWEPASYRSTRDLDFLARGDTDRKDIETLVRAICEVKVEPDGLHFDLDGMRIEEIREATDYRGFRVRFLARLGSARIQVQIDVGVGDAAQFQEIRLSTLLSMPEPRLLGYTAECVAAEKLETIVVLGIVNSRMKDYYDLWTLATKVTLDQLTLVQAVKATFVRRSSEIPSVVPIGLSDEFAADAAKVAQWRAFLVRSHLKGPNLRDVVEAIREWATPVFREAGE